MMKSEYVGFTGTEKTYAEKNLLSMQLELLNFLRSFRAYGLLRQQELLMKIQLKNKIRVVLELMESFDKFLPKTGFNTEVVEIRKIDKERKEDAGLLAEIEKIRLKLEELSREI